ncbi:hypothetical protein JTB14_029598 [Gonioctena quinquepunctata]|nr:hypothetical protein JTB14_029598 [Gonioctena quinquepunctata]
MSSSPSSSDSSSERKVEKEKEQNKVVPVVARLTRRRKERKRKQKIENTGEGCMDIPLNLKNDNRSMVPMSKEEWEKKRSVITRVYDESTGRHRLVKGDGEIVEEIVSRDRHKAINQQATKGDGEFFQNKLRHKLEK